MAATSTNSIRKIISTCYWQWRIYWWTSSA